jgi:hypothetical protein
LNLLLQRHKIVSTITILHDRNSTGNPAIKNARCAYRKCFLPKHVCQRTNFHIYLQWKHTNIRLNMKQNSKLLLSNTNISRRFIISDYLWKIKRKINNNNSTERILFDFHTSIEMRLVAILNSTVVYILFIFFSKRVNKVNFIIFFYSKISYLMLRKVSTDCIRRMATSGIVHKVQHDGKNKVFYVELLEAKQGSVFSVFFSINNIMFTFILCILHIKAQSTVCRISYIYTLHCIYVL